MSRNKSTIATIPDDLRCINCLWHSGGEYRGHCRRNAPGPNGWPIVFALDWCGEHTPDKPT